MALWNCWGTVFGFRIDANRHFVAVHPTEIRLDQKVSQKQACIPLVTCVRRCQSYMVRVLIADTIGTRDIRSFHYALLLRGNK
jgi:hypothetical protein